MRAFNPVLELAISFRQSPDNLIITSGCVSVEACSDQLNRLTDTEFVRRHTASPSLGASDGDFSLLYRTYDARGRVRHERAKVPQEGWYLPPVIIDDPVTIIRLGVARRAF